MSILNRAYNSFNRRIADIKDNSHFGSFGRKSYILKPMRLIGKKRMFIGERVRILNNARIETIREWGGYQLNGRFLIGDNSSIEQCCHIIAANRVEIGRNSVLSAYVYISDCSHGYPQEGSIIGSDLEIKAVKIGNNCFIGIGSCVMPGVTLGDHVVIGANSVVTKDIPADYMAVGSPARVIKKYDYNVHDWVKI